MKSLFIEAVKEKSLDRMKLLLESCNTYSQREELLQISRQNIGLKYMFLDALSRSDEGYNPRGHDSDWGTGEAYKAPNTHVLMDFFHLDPYHYLEIFDIELLNTYNIRWKHIRCSVYCKDQFLDLIKNSNPLLFLLYKNPLERIIPGRILSKIKSLLYSGEEDPNFLKLALVTKSPLLPDNVLSIIGHILGEKEIATIAARGIREIQLSTEERVVEEKEICGEGTGGLMQSNIEFELSNLHLKYPSIIDTKLLHLFELIENNQYLLMIDPLSKGSKFSRVLDSFIKANDMSRVLYSGFQQDSSTCGDHSLITLSDIAGSLDSMCVKAGIVAIKSDCLRQW